MRDIESKPNTPSRQHFEMANSEIQKVPINELEDDNEALAQLGHVQELRRDYSIWSLGALCLCLMATWEALASVVATALITGGAPCLFFNLYV